MLKNGGDATPIGAEVSIFRRSLAETEPQNVQSAGKGIPRRPFFSYNLSNSQWYIQWLRTLRTGEPKGSPKDQKVGRCSNDGRLFSSWA
jgi:hypothetical protein